MTEEAEFNPAKYRRNCARDAEKLILLGATRAEVTKFFGVDDCTISRWSSEHKDFYWALGTAPSALGVSSEDIGLFSWLKDYRRGYL